MQTSTAMLADDPAQVAARLTKAQRDCLLMLPCDFFAYLPSASFHTLGLMEFRRRFWFGPWQQVATPLGLAVRAILQETDNAPD